MTCPKCGRPMPEDALYCENCGEEIHIVPEFDLELEESISQGMETVKAGVEQEVGVTPSRPGADNSEREEERASGRKRGGHLGLLIGIVSLLVLLPCVSVLGLLYFRHTSVNYQLNQAQLYRNRMEYAKAVSMYKRAIELEPEEGEIRLLLADTYGLMGDSRAGEKALLQVTDLDVFSEEARIKAYGKLAALYQEQDRYKELSDLLLACKLEAVRKKYAAFMVEPPVFSFEEGEYKEILPLKLMSALPGDIYYTLNGEDPLTGGELYTGPIFLDTGDYVVKACLISDKGVASQVVSGEYRIEVEAVPAPNMYPSSGSYSGSLMIRVASGSERDIYYTTDGTEPNMQSDYFAGSIPIPFGTSHYRFAYITEDGRSSLIADLDYTMTPAGSITREAALKKVMDYMVSSEKVYDDQGHVAEGSSAAYGCECNYSVAINGSDYYVLEEIYTDADGLRTHTGSMYGVEANTGDLYRVRMQGTGTYTLTEHLLEQ